MVNRALAAARGLEQHGPSADPTLQPPHQRRRIQHPAGKAPFVVVPADHVRQPLVHDRGLRGIERARYGGVVEIDADQRFRIVYLVHAIIRYLIGSIILKLSVTSSQYVRQLRGTSSRKNASMAMLKSLKLG